MSMQLSMSKAAVFLLWMTTFIGSQAFASGEAREVQAILGAGTSQGIVLGSPWAPREAYSVSMLGLWEAGQGFGARLTLLPTSPSAGAWELSADAIVRFANDGPLYLKGIGGIAKTPDFSWPLRFRAGGEAGVHAIRGRIGLEAGIAAIYSVPFSRPAEGEVMVSLGVGILFGFGPPARAPAIRYLENSSAKTPGLNPSGASARQDPRSSSAGGGITGWHSDATSPGQQSQGADERDVIQQILLLQKPGEVMSWWASGPGKDVTRWGHPLSQWEKKYIEAMTATALPEPIRMWPPVAPEHLTPEQTEAMERLLGRGVAAARAYSQWENRRRIVKHYVMTHPATLQLSLSLYGLARDSNPLSFALERGWQVARGKEMFTAQEVSGLGAAAEFFTMLAAGVAVGKLISAPGPVPGRGFQSPVEAVRPGLKSEVHPPVATLKVRPPNPRAAQTLPHVEEHRLAATGTDPVPAQVQRPAQRPLVMSPRSALASENYRGRYNAARHAEGKSRLPDDWDAHHRIPREYREHPEFKDFDFDAPSNIQGVKGSRADVNIHQEITNRWAEFRRTNPNATRAQIEAFAREIDVQFQQHWWQ